MDLIENNWNCIRILLSNASKSSVFPGNLPRKHGTGLSVWIAASLSFSSLFLNIHGCGWAKLWVQLCQAWKPATFHPWSSEQGWRCVLSTVLWPDLWGEKECSGVIKKTSYSCAWNREDADTASVGWQGVAQGSHLHSESTYTITPTAPRGDRKQWLSCPLQEAAALSGQALDNVVPQQVLQDEVVRKR